MDIDRSSMKCMSQAQMVKDVETSTKEQQNDK
jgi:hypothetical protein